MGPVQTARQRSRWIHK
uniref:Uncharacterized protein n=1 Tax=Anguilla anguilla TaxID=7936 RepID=A0A0E9VY85_ANGAN